MRDRLLAACRQGAAFGAGSRLAGLSTNVEFVSADPTGPLPFSLAHAAASGDAVCRLLERQGALVTREFYVNDGARSAKMQLVGESVAVRYLRAFGQQVQPPEGALDDSFVGSVADDIVRHAGNAYLLVPEAERTAAFAARACERAVEAQRRTLQQFGVNFAVWASEDQLNRQGRVHVVLQRLREAGHLYEKDGAWWVRTTTFGDQSDRPLVRASGEATYLAGDLAYHAWKFERGFKHLINIWTLQHRPYVQRTHAALQALGYAVSEVEIRLCAPAAVTRDQQVVQATSRGPVLLDDLVQEIPAPALRYWLVQHPWEQAPALDLEDGPEDIVSHWQQVQAVLQQLVAQPAASELPEHGDESLSQLVLCWPEVAEQAALERAPWIAARWVAGLVTAVQSTPPTTALVAQAAQQALRNALDALGLTV